MSLFKQNTEEALLHKLASIKGESSGWSIARLSAGFLNASQIKDIRTKKGHELFSGLVYQEKITPFFCNDNDVFFVFRGTKKHSQEALERMVCALWPQFEEENVDLDSFFHYYTLPESYEKVCDIIRKKEKAFHHQQKKVEVVSKAGGDIKESEYQWSDMAFKRALNDREFRSKKIILIADDDEMMRELARASLSRHCKVITARDGIQAC